MSIRWRILLAFLLIAAFGLAALGRLVIKDLWPHTQQTAEESLAETATLLASVVEQSARAGDLDVDVLRASMAVAGQRSLQAKIHEVDKQRIDLRVYVTDARGVVLFDSDEHRDEGRDYSRWNDVKLTLLGRYGARATRDQAQDPFTSTLYVAAPIRKNGRIVGVLSVGKPVSALRPFFLVTSRRVITITLLLFAVAALLSLALAFWITRPIARLTDYARGISAGQRPRLPPLDGREIALLGESMEKMRVALEGQAYVENFVRSLTHELKAPLSAIRAAAELLNEEMAASDRERFLRNILSETARVQTLIDKLLALSSIETRQRIERRDGVALDDFVRETLDGATTLAARKHIQISARTGPATRIEGDAFLLRQALLNLVHNAITATPAGGEIVIETRDEGERIAITVTDTGPGVPDYALPRVFERFYSLPIAGAEKNGTGLGLPFVREVAHLHGGEATLENLPTGGARATLTLLRQAPA